MKEIEIKVNTVYSKVLDPEVIKILNNKFYAEQEGYRFTWAHTNRGWNGRYYPVLQTGTFQTGMLPLFVEYLAERGYEVYVEDTRPAQLVPQQLPLTYLRDYQKDIVNQVCFNMLGELEFYRGIIDGATNTGKTYIVRGIWEVFGKAPMLFLVHRKKLFEQQLEYFQSFHDSVGQITDKVAELDKDIVVGMYRSAYKHKPKMQHFKILIVDEGHMAKGKMYKNIVTGTRGADIRYYISGTALKVSDVDKNRIIGSSGAVLSRISNKYLIDAGFSAAPEITMQTVHGGASNYRDWRKVYKDLIVHNKARNTYIQHFVQHHRKTRNVWVVCRFVDHAKLLGSYLSAPVLTGSTPKVEYDDVVARYRARTINVVVSTMIIDVGMNLPIEAFVLALGGKSEIDTLQLIGRSVRKTGGFDDVQVLDFYDIGPFVEDHSAERARIYELEQFKVTKL